MRQGTHDSPDNLIRIGKNAEDLCEALSADDPHRARSCRKRRRQVAVIFGTPLANRLILPGSESRNARRCRENIRRLHLLRLDSRIWKCLA